MKIGVMMNVYNEIDWIDAALSSIVDWADEIVIVEGAYGIAIEAGAPKRSDDGTLERLILWESAHDNITVLHKNERDEAPQLQCGINVLKKLKIDWYLLVDGDEIWEPNSLVAVKKAMINGERNGIYQYRVHFYNFINSFDLHYDAVMKRIFKLTPGAIAVGQNGLIWPDHGKSVDTGGDLPHVAVLNPAFKCYHYTEIKPAGRWLLKKKYLKVRDGNPRFDSWKATKDGFVNDEKNIKKFTKKHPEIVKGTRLYKLWAEDPELLRKDLFDD